MAVVPHGRAPRGPVPRGRLERREARLGRHLRADTRGLHARAHSISWWSSISSLPHRARAHGPGRVQATGPGRRPPARSPEVKELPGSWRSRRLRALRRFFRSGSRSSGAPARLPGTRGATVVGAVAVLSDVHGRCRCSRRFWPSREVRAASLVVVTRRSCGRADARGDPRRPGRAGERGVLVRGNADRELTETPLAPVRSTWSRGGFGALWPDHIDRLGRAAAPGHPRRPPASAAPCSATDRRGRRRGRAGRLPAGSLGDVLIARGERTHRGLRSYAHAARPARRPSAGWSTREHRSNTLTGTGATR